MGLGNLGCRVWGIGAPGFVGLGAPGFSSPRIVRIAVIAGGSGSSSRLRLRSRSRSGSGSGHSRRRSSTARTLQPEHLKIQNCWAWNEEL